MNDTSAAIARLHDRLSGVSFDFAFIGGSVLSLLVNDPTADAIRVTKDVDVLVGVRTRRDFHRQERELESRGFHHDTSEGAPICRWNVDGLVVDVLPVREEVLGWESRWFEAALESAASITVEGRQVKVVTPPFFVALKLEAFESRGRGDFVASTDFEDVICLFNGRPGVVEEILSDQAVGPSIAEKFAQYVNRSGLEDAVLGFVQTESNSDERYAAIMSAFRKLAQPPEPPLSNML